jgi:nucleotide-binding universal stress UspA family protein
VHLLLCTDGTPRSEPAAAFGCRLAAQLGARVTVLEATASPAQPFLPALSAASLCATLSAAGLESRTVVRPEVPRQAIVRQAAEEAYDLVILGLLQRGNWLRRWLRGPSTRRVLQGVTAPVLVVPADRPVLRRILLCSGDLWYPAAMVRFVGTLAQATGAEVTLLHVTPHPTRYYPILRHVEDAWGALLQTDTPQGRNLKLGRDALVSLGIETGISLRYGSVVDQILAEIREGEYELVALGSTYAARSLRRYFVRSITDLVVEQAGRPVLVMRNVS